MTITFGLLAETPERAEVLTSEGAPVANMTAGNFRAVMAGAFGMGFDVVGADELCGVADPMEMLALREDALAWGDAQPVEWLPGSGGWESLMRFRVVEILSVCEVAARLGCRVSWA